MLECDIYLKEHRGTFWHSAFLNALSGQDRRRQRGGEAPRREERQAMRSGRQRSWRRGFTLVETLAAVAIVIILLGVSAVGVVYYARWLKITELDNAAREIYLAAENRAVLLSGSDRLEKLVSNPGQSVTVTLESGSDSTAPGYYIHHTDGNEVANLLSLGTVDPSLMDGTFYIVYEPKGGSVTDVFYAESEPKADGVDFQTFYQKVSTSPRSDRMQMKPMVGYYGGGTAENARDGALDVPTVTIRNEETLTAEITYTALPSMADKNMALEVKLIYGDCEVDISEAVTLLSQTETYGRTRFTYTVTLDSLEANRHFSDLFKDPSKFKDSSKTPDPFGGDFTVTATLTAEGGAASSSGIGRGNSLFAEGSSDETAYIANLRHLQNLDKITSGVAGKKNAVQKNHIDCASYLGKSYTFKPIENAELTSYNGGSFALRGLHAEGSTNAGLFAGVAGTGPEPENLWKFQNIRMVNASAKGAVSAGALVGYAQNAEFKNCWVYWEPETGSLRNKLVDADGGYIYQITGAYVGGLAGQMVGGSIETCLAATLVNGTAAAGGLVGQAADTVNDIGETIGVTITDSYADCYLTGDFYVGGLAGTAGTLKLTNCFAAGFIDIPVTPVALDPDGETAEPSVSAAGLCTSGTVTGNSVYSAMRYSGTANWLPLAPDLSAWTNYYYLSLAFDDSDEHAMIYKNMTGSGFANALGSAFKTKLPKDSHPYNLRTGLALTVYDFPGLANLPHYGDWSAQFVEESLVYYEQYSEVAYGFYGGGVDALQNAPPMKDGYAIAIRDEGSAAEYKYDINGRVCTYTSEGGEDIGKLYPVTKESEDGTASYSYLLAPLPDDLVIGGTVSEDFYQSLIFATKNEASGEAEKTYTYFYCPHFAKTAVKTDKKPSAPSVVSVRTPRHLYMLSKYPEYYHGGYSFYQEMDLNYRYQEPGTGEDAGEYAVYTGYGIFPEGSGLSFPKDFIQASIGSYSEPFNGFYDGGCRAILGLRFKPETGTTPVYAGLFGYSSGTLRNIVYSMDAGQNAVSLDKQNTLYFGSLAGGNAGSIVNCAVENVSLTGSAYTATIYLGGLVGLNQGDISNSAAECAALSANTSSYAHAYVGGLVGLNRNSGLISASYAVGRASADADEASGARVCGFAGYNQGLIQYSYAAMDLASSGKAVETYGFCGVSEGTQRGTFFLNMGNFTYRDVPYNASYTSDGTTALTYSQLAARESDPVTGMRFVKPGDPDDPDNPDKPDVFPYPTAVKDAENNAVHYGKWPEPMDLGVMGVYYWEKLEINGKKDYYISLLAVDSVAPTITKQTTLSNAHSDNGVVTDYGYGYYYSEEATGVTLTTADISYTSTYNTVGSAFQPESAAQAGEANDALAALMPGYTFRSYHSYDAVMGASSGGLYPSSEYTDYDPSYTDDSSKHPSKLMATSGTNGVKINIKDYTRKPNGTFTLKQDGVEVRFTINPHFADALAVQVTGKIIKNDDGEDIPDPNDSYTLAGYTLVGAPPDAPGSSEENPYEVRALSQLQNINWCVKPDGGSDNTIDGLSNSKVVNNNDNGSFGGNQYGFLYLSHDVRWGTNDTTVDTYQGVSRGAYNFSWSELYEYYWVQTHDIDGRKNDNTYSSFTPIAAFSDRTTNPSGGVAQKKGDTILTAWFGGSYDGGDYTIKNINIAATNANCVGLFGVTLDATLKNIILYSESGDNTVTVSGRTAYNDLYSWYAAGGLVGLAGVSAEKENAAKTISNCSVAGYKIVDNTQRSNPREYGGGAVGGLVGVCNLGLSNCTASTTIEMRYQRNNINDNNRSSPVRVGGLAGTCVASISNCYAYGKIVENENTVNTGNIYVGGLVGGAGMRRIYVPYFIASASEGTVKIENSYSTVKLPGTTGTSENAGNILESRAIGGPGGSDADKYTVTVDNCYALGNPDDGEPFVSYAQLAGEQPIVDGKKIYTLLNESKSESELHFSPVTKTENGFSVSGKYSYASESKLQGLDYPFPTILTRDGGRYHVHYGDWPVNGITRDAGGAPLELDLFTTPPVHTETLGLAEGISNLGTWSVEAASVNTGELDENGDPVTKQVVEAKIENGELTVEGKGVGVTTLKVTYTTTTGVEYTLPLAVNVTAVLELSPKDNPVRLFTNDEVGIQLAVYGKDRKELTRPEDPKVTAAAVERYDPAQLSRPKVEDDLTLKLVTRNEGDAAMSIGYTYTYGGVTYTGKSAITFQVEQPTIKKDEENEAKRLVVFKGGENISAVVTSGNLAGDKLSIDQVKNTVTLDMTGVPPEKAVTIKVTLTMNERQHVVTVTIPAGEQDGSQTG